MTRRDGRDIARPCGRQVSILRKRMCIDFARDEATLRRINTRALILEAGKCPAGLGWFGAWLGTYLPISRLVGSSDDVRSLSVIRQSVWPWCCVSCRRPVIRRGACLAVRLAGGRGQHWVIWQTVVQRTGCGVGGLCRPLGWRFVHA
jgi:hypothetical protein